MANTSSSTCRLIDNSRIIKQWRHPMQWFSVLQSQSIISKTLPSTKDPPKQYTLCYRQLYFVHVLYWMNFVSYLAKKSTWSWCTVKTTCQSQWIVPQEAYSIISMDKVLSWNYSKTSSISCTKPQSFNVSCMLLQLSSISPLKAGVELNMKM